MTPDTGYYQSNPHFSKASFSEVSVNSNVFVGERFDFERKH